MLQCQFQSGSNATYHNTLSIKLSEIYTCVCLTRLREIYHHEAERKVRDYMRS